MSTAKMFDSDQAEILFSLIVNQKIGDAGNNYLHHLVNQMTVQNFSEVSEMIKVLVVSKCSVNSLNSKSETPLHCLLKKLQNLRLKNDLLEFFIHNAEIDSQINHNSIESFKLAGFLREEKITIRFPRHANTIKDVNFMNHLLEQWQEEKFIDEFENFAYHVNTNLTVLLKTAAARNMTKIVTLLLTNGADVDGISNVSKFRMPSAFIACYFGHHKILRALLIHSSLNFKSAETRRNLLHQVCFPSQVTLKDRRKCFEVLLSDRRCTHEMINEEDEKGFVPLHYAMKNGFDDIALGLVKRGGASIDHSSIINHISREAQKCFFQKLMASSSFSQSKVGGNIDDSKVSLMFGEPDSEFNDNERLLDRLEMIAWLTFVALIFGFLIFSIVGIYRNIRDDSGNYNDSDVLQSGFKINHKIVQSLVGGGKIDPSML